MQALARETTIEGVTNTLAVFPQGLSTMYDEMFRRIGQQSTTDQVSALKVIKWLYYAIDDFSPKTIVQAKDNLSLAADPSEEIMKRKIDNVLHVCCGLIVYDPETGILRFSHATVRQYLDEGPKDYVKGGQEWILDRCFSILTCPSSERPDPSSLTSSRQDLFTYSMRNWGTHLRGTNRAPSWSSFLNPLSPHYEFWAHNIGMLIPTLKAPTGEAITLVWAACYYRLFDVVERNLHTFTPTSTNSAGRTPLHYLAEKGDLDLLMKLVDQINVDLNVRDEVGLTPLILAVKYNRAETVSFLLRIKRQSVVPQMGGGDAGTTLTQMSTYCDINLADKNGLTAIHHATAEGHNTVLEYILRDPLLNINHKSKAGDTALSLAVGEGNELAVQALLQHKDIDPNCTNSRSETPLITAARLEHRNVLELLIEHERIDANCGMGLDNLFIKAAEDNKAWLVELLLKGKNIDIERRGVSEWTALHNAVESGSLEALKLLLSHGADVNALTEESWTPLHAAAWNGRTEITKLLLSHGADVKCTIKNGSTALYLAAEFNYVESVRELLSHGADIDRASDSGHTPLHIAISENSMESARELIAHGADVKAVTPDSWTPLHIAAWKGKTEIMKSLLSHGANIDSAIADGSTALHIAVQFMQTESLRELLLASADVNMVAHDPRKDTNHAKYSDRTALHYACESGSIDAVKVLLEDARIDVKCTNNHGSTPLLIASQDGHIEIVKLLLERYEKTDKLQEMDADGDGILMCAAYGGHTSMIEFLLERGGHDINFPNKLGDTVLICAATEGHTAAVELLLKQEGIDVTLSNKEGKTAFDVAKEGGYEEIMALLRPHMVVEEA
jgi:ankyrin repeat protein